MSYSGYDYRDWFETSEGKAYYEKYMKDIGGINEDHLTNDTTQQIKNAFYQYVNKTYEVQDKLTDTADSIIKGIGNFKNNAILVIILILIGYFYYKRGLNGKL